MPRKPRGEVTIDDEVFQRSTGKTVRERTTKSALYHLTPQELRFVQASAQGASAAEAARQAGFRGDGDRARVRGWRLMQKPVIRAAIYELRASAWDRVDIEVTQWLREVATLAFMPPEMMEGKPKWSDKTAMLRMVGEFQKLIGQKDAKDAKDTVIGLIVQAANPQMKTVASLEPVAVQQAAPDDKK